MLNHASWVILDHLGSIIQQTGSLVTKTAEGVALIKGRTDGSHLGPWEEKK